VGLHQVLARKVNGMIDALAGAYVVALADAIADDIEDRARDLPLAEEAYARIHADAWRLAGKRVASQKARQS